jgi:hypothetical protein
MAQEFAEKEMKPNAVRYDKADVFPEDVMKKAFEAERPHGNRRSPFTVLAVRSFLDGDRWRKYGSLQLSFFLRPRE